MTRRVLPLVSAILLALSLPGCVIDFSPDGKQIAFPWPNGMAVMNVDGTGFRMLPGTDNSVRARWAPDGQRIAIDRIAGAEVLQTFLYQPGQKSLKQLGSGLAMPAWYSDGKHLAFAVEKPDYRLVTYDVAAQRIVARSTPVPGEIKAATIVTIPGTLNAAFLGGKGQREDVYLVQGGLAKRLTTSGDAAALRVDTSGKRLLWALARGGGDAFEVYAYDLASGRSSRLPFRSAPGAGRIKLGQTDYAELSPSGQAVVLVHTASQKPGTPSKGKTPCDCFLYRQNGTSVKLLEVALPDVSMTYGVAWSRDGRILAVWEPAAQYASLYTFNADGSGRKLLRRAPVK